MNNEKFHYTYAPRKNQEVLSILTYYIPQVRTTQKKQRLPDHQWVSSLPNILQQVKRKLHI